MTIKTGVSTHESMRMAATLAMNAEARAELRRLLGQFEELTRYSGQRYDETQHLSGFLHGLDLEAWPAGDLREGKTVEASPEGKTTDALEGGKPEPVSDFIAQVEAIAFNRPLPGRAMTIEEMSRMRYDDPDANDAGELMPSPDAVLADAAAQFFTAHADLLHGLTAYARQTGRAAYGDDLHQLDALVGARARKAGR